MGKGLPYPGGYPYVNAWLPPDKRYFLLLILKTRE